MEVVIFLRYSTHTSMQNIKLNKIAERKMHFSEYKKTVDFFRQHSPLRSQSKLSRKMKVLAVLLVLAASCYGKTLILLTVIVYFNSNKKYLI